MLRLILAAALAAAAPHGVPAGKPLATPLSEAGAIALAPDGRALYAVAGLDARSRLIAFIRDARTGALRRLRGRATCRFSWVAPSRFRVCAPERGLNVPTVVAVAPDGRGVLVASFSSSPPVTSYARDPATGALRLGGCVDRADYRRAPCRTAWVDRVSDIALSPDGRSVYLSSPRDIPALAVVSRAPATGALASLADAAGCVGHAGLAAFWHRPCTELPVRRFVPVGAVVSPDGRFVYVASAPFLEPPILFAFARDARTGALQPLPGTTSCLSVRPRPSCAALPPVAIAGRHGLVLAPDGATLYLAGHAGASGDDGVVIALARDAASGALTPLTPVGIPGGRLDEVAVAPDGRTVYAPTARGLASFRRSSNGSLALLTIDRRLLVSELVPSRDGRTLYGVGGPGLLAVPLAP